MENPLFVSKPRIIFEYGKGQAVLTVVLLALFAGFAIFFGISGLAINEAQSARRVLFSEKALFAAEAGTEDLAYRIIFGKAHDVLETVVVDGSVASTTVASSSKLRELVSYGETSSHIRLVKIVLETGSGASFNYGVQIGDGGLFMENNSAVSGSVYSNGNITGQNSPSVTGDVFAAASSTVSDMEIGGNAGGFRLSNNTISGSATATEVIWGGSIGGRGYADKFSGGAISGDAYYVTSISATTTVGGARIQMPEASPVLQKLSMPISDAQIDLWESEAAAGGTTTPQSCPFKPANGSVLGPTKITCGVSIEGTNIVTLAGTLWVVGDFNMQNSAQLRLAPSFGALSGAVIADKTAVDNITDRLTSSRIKIQNSSQMLGSGQSGSHIMAVSRNNSAESGGGEKAIEVANSSSAAIYYAPHGEILIQNNVDLKEVTAWRIHIKNLATITYESGLADIQFSSGPSGGWSIKSWGETK